MEPASAVTEPRAPAPPAAPLAWPIGVQIALVVIVTASVFFLLGRWSHEAPRALPEATAAEPAATALDLNRATKAELRLIPGIGDALAQRIVTHRQRVGAFRSVDELRQVSGIGPKTLERIRHQLFVSPEESLVSDDEGDAMPETKLRTPTKAATSSKKVAELKAPINVNIATQAELQKLPGIGPKLSQRILEVRAKAAFKSIEDLRRVPGIGVKTLDKLRPFVTVGTPP